MNQTSIKLREWAINKIKTEYPDDIALLIGVPSGSVNNDGHGEPFDYFIPCTERGFELSQTFIIDGVGNDLYPRDWERTIRTASLEDLATLCLGDGVILYARSKEDVQRFEEIRQQLFDNLSNPLFVYGKAAEQIDHAMNQFKNIMFEEQLGKARAKAGFIQYYLMNAVNFLNGTYWKAWHDGVIPALRSLTSLPEGFIPLYEQMLSANEIDELRNICHIMIQNTRRFYLSYKPQVLMNQVEENPTPDFHELADWYQELRTTFNRMYYYCDMHHADAVFSDAVNLQNELYILSESLPLSVFDLLDVYDCKDLSGIKKRAGEIESCIRKLLDENHVILEEYTSVDDFISAQV